MTERQCEYCSYYDKGECHFNPPKHKNEHTYYSTFFQVAPDHKCKEFTTKKLDIVNCAVCRHSNSNEYESDCNLFPPKDHNDYEIFIITELTDWCGQFDFKIQEDKPGPPGQLSAPSC